MDAKMETLKKSCEEEMNEMKTSLLQTGLLKPNISRRQLSTNLALAKSFLRQTMRKM